MLQGAISPAALADIIRAALSEGGAGAMGADDDLASFAAKRAIASIHASRPTSPLEAPIDGKLREAAISAVGEAVDYLDWGGAERAVDAILSLLNSSQAKEAGGAEGWKLVPVEPTEAMIEAGWNAYGEVDARYRAMIAAAPASAGEEP